MRRKLASCLPACLINAQRRSSRDQKFFFTTWLTSLEHFNAIVDALQGFSLSGRAVLSLLRPAAKRLKTCCR